MAKPATAITKSQARRAALGSALVLVVLYPIMGLVKGQSLAAAAFEGSTRALVGLAAWYVYHLASRRNDGFLFLICSSLGMFSGDPPYTLPFAVFQLVPMALVATIVGLLARQFARERKEEVPHDPLYDADVDQARTAYDP